MYRLWAQLVCISSATDTRRPTSWHVFHETHVKHWVESETERGVSAGITGIGWVSGLSDVDGHQAVAQVFVWLSNILLKSSIISSVGGFLSSIRFPSMNPNSKRTAITDHWLRAVSDRDRSGSKRWLNREDRAMLSLPSMPKQIYSHSVFRIWTKIVSRIPPEEEEFEETSPTKTKKSHEWLKMISNHCPKRSMTTWRPYSKWNLTKMVSSHVKTSFSKPMRSQVKSRVVS